MLYHCKLDWFWTQLCASRDGSGNLGVITIPCEGGPKVKLRNFDVAKSFRSADSWQSNGRKTQILKNSTLPRLSLTQFQPRVPQLRWGFTWLPGFYSPGLSGKKTHQKCKWSLNMLSQVYLLQGKPKKSKPLTADQCPANFPWAYNEVPWTEIAWYLGPQNARCLKHVLGNHTVMLTCSPYLHSTSKRPYKTLWPSLCPCDTTLLGQTLFGPDVHQGSVLVFTKGQRLLRCKHWEKWSRFGRFWNRSLSFCNEN